MTIENGNCQRFSGQTVIVTGAASGIGAATARRLVGEGAVVVLVDIDETGLGAIKREVENAGGACRTIVGSAAQTETWTCTLEAASALGRRIDGLFNNAGITGALAPFDRADPEDFERLIDINLRSVLLGMHAVLPEMINQRSGAIVNTASISANRGMPGFSHYGMTKAAVTNLTLTTAIEFAAHGVRVNAVCPGVIATNIMEEWDKRAGDEKAAARREALARTIPMKRYGTAEEVSAVVAFLLSDDAAYVTGASVPVDGGTLAR